MNAILVFCKEETDEQKEEMYDLLRTAGIQIKNTFYQNVKAVSRSTYIGKGKCEEIALYLADEQPIDTIVFSTDLSVMQVRELENIFDRQVLDRTDLILQIFMERARSAAARLQIESAQLQRQMNRLIGTNVHLTRQRGGVTNRGAGEKQLQLDKRLIKTRIAQINKELKKLSRQRETQRSNRLRSNLPIVALAGYTNAGKSTLMNKMLSLSGRSETKQVFQENLLFATLDTSVRIIELPYGQSFLLADTVGFLEDLPHELVQAFHSTLEDIRYASCILQIVNASSPRYLDNMKTTLETLEDIHASHIDRLVVYNQCDKTEIHHPALENGNVYISALSSNDVEFLIDQVCEQLYGPWTEEELFVAFNDFERQQKLRAYANILETQYEEDGMKVRFLIRQAWKKTVEM